MKEFYRVRILTERHCKEDCDILINSLWGAYHLFAFMYEETGLGDCVILYDPGENIIEYKINDGEIPFGKSYYRKMQQIAQIAKAKH